METDGILPAEVLWRLEAEGRIRRKNRNGIVTKEDIILCPLLYLQGRYFSLDDNS